MIVKDKCSYINRNLCLFQSYRFSKNLRLLSVYRVIIVIELLILSSYRFYIYQEEFAFIRRLYLL